MLIFSHKKKRLARTSLGPADKCLRGALLPTLFDWELLEGAIHGLRHVLLEIAANLAVHLSAKHQAAGLTLHDVHRQRPLEVPARPHVIVERPAPGVIGPEIDDATASQPERPIPVLREA